jgi:serine/threonine protein kinase
MKSGSGLWITLGEPASPAEADALEKFRELLPDDGIATAWTNVTILSREGRTDEIDVILLTRAGLFVLEFKGWHGTITGNMSEWQHDQGARVERVKNPYILNDSKAKRLASLLKEVAAGVPGRPRVPFVVSRVVMHGENSTVHLDDRASSGVLALDGYRVAGLDGSEVSTFLAAPPTHDVIDMPRAKQIRAILDRAGLVPTPKTRTAGHYSIDDADPLGEGEGWQDVLVTHPVTGRKRRMRLFDVPRGASAESRQQIELNAKREFAFTDGLTFPGITRAVEYFDTESGPALLFDYNPADIPLDVYIAGDGAALSLDDRLLLLRKIGEVLQYAHNRRLTHRALTPRQIYVNTTDGMLTVTVRDWMAAQRSTTTTRSLTIMSGGASDVGALVEHESWVYLAPETLRHVVDAPAIALDVYGLGSVGYLVLTGHPPAPNVKALSDRFESFESLDPLAVSPDLPEPVASVIRQATQFAELHRTVDMESLLNHLEMARAEITAPDDPAELRPTEGDPLDATKGEAIADRFIVKDRRGSGTTGTALLVDDVDMERPGVILKLARDDAAATRLATEADVLRSLEHPRIVELIEGPVTVGSRTALILSDAGDETLSRKLQNEGRLTIEQLERFGADLLEAVAYLDSKGVFHRDIKPANLAVAPDRSTRKPRLNLFDLSLANEPLRNLNSGSRPYLDPFLGTGRRQQYDRAAELYAVAITLFEMAVGTPPWWNDGDGAPSNASDSIVLTDTLFDAGAAAGLRLFFAKALAPAAASRFVNVSEMADGWRHVFEAVDAPTAVEQSAASPDELAAQAELTTPLAQAGLTARAQSALTRLSVVTVGDLLAVPPIKLNALRGMGERIRKEVQGRVRSWRQQLLTAGADLATVETATRQSVERRVQTLIPRPTTSNHTEVAVLRVLLGVDADPAADSWPTLSAMAGAAGISAMDASQRVLDASARWRRSGALRSVLDDVVASVAARGRIATVDEVAASLLLSYGSSLDGVARHRRAVGLMRAAFEMDSSADKSRLALRRQKRPNAPILLALTRAVISDASPEMPATPDAVLNSATALADTVDSALVQAEIVVPGVLAGQLRRQAPDLLVPDTRLLELAVAASATGALSSVGEIYRVGMAGDIAVEAALRGTAVRELSVEGIRRRTESRFPHATALPTRPALDAVVKRTHPHLQWSGEDYRLRDTLTASSRTSTRSITQYANMLPAAEIHERLAASLNSNSALTLTIHPQQYDAMQRTLVSRYRVTPVDLAGQLVTRVRARADQMGAKWSVVSRADAADPSSPDFGRLLELVRLAMGPYWQELSADERPLLLTNAGPLARYGLTDLLAQFADLSLPRPAARWLLVPHRPTKATPDLDGVAIPFGADRWIALPSNPADLIPSLTGDAA